MAKLGKNRVAPFSQTQCIWKPTEATNTWLFTVPEYQYP